MDAVVLERLSIPEAPADHSSGLQTEKLTDCLLDALKYALAAPGEHRLFRAGKLEGLFPAKYGIGAEAARQALADGLIELTRTETKGKTLVEWVRATPRAVAYVDAHDTPKAVLRELKTMLGFARTGLPAWMVEAREEMVRAAAKFEEKSQALLERLDHLNRRVEAALRRQDATRIVADTPLVQVVPWANDVLEYLDQRDGAGAGWVCPLSELFHYVVDRQPGIVLAEFHNGLKRLHEARAIQLTPATAQMREPEFAMVVDGKLMGFATR
jgi:hypothetical protein